MASISKLDMKGGNGVGRKGRNREPFKTCFDLYRMRSEMKDRIDGLIEDARIGMDAGDINEVQRVERILYFMLAYLNDHYE